MRYHYGNTVCISTQVGCKMGCAFCASGALEAQPSQLVALDYLRQINTCLLDNGINSADYKNFYVSFAGIGEPSVCFEEVKFGMKMIHDVYPNVRFNIATMGYRAESIREWGKDGLPIRTLQIPLYHTETEKIKEIVKNLPAKYELSEVINEAVKYKQEHNECRIKINYIPFEGINDGDRDIEIFSNFLEPYKNDISLKVSVLNYTLPASENGYFGVGIEKLEVICQFFKDRGFEAYVFGSEKNTMLGCGQLAQNHISDDKYQQ